MPNKPGSRWQCNIKKEMSIKVKKALVALAMMIALPFVCGSECDDTSVTQDPTTKLPRIETSVDYGIWPTPTPTPTTP